MDLYQHPKVKDQEDKFKQREKELTQQVASKQNEVDQLESQLAHNQSVTEQKAAELERQKKISTRQRKQKKIGWIQTKKLSYMLSGKRFLISYLRF